jgi:hypothetical protein
MTYSELAKKYNITVEKLKQLQHDFVQCEGYADSGYEFINLEDYIKYNTVKFEKRTKPVFFKSLCE